MKTLKTLAAALIVIALAACPARAQEHRAPRPTTGAIREFQRLAAEVRGLFREKKYEETIEICRRMSALLPRHPNSYYNLACAQARLGKTDEALGSLAKSVERGFNDPAHMQKDEDLASLRGDKRFSELVKKARENAKRAAGRYEPGADIPGVKTIEGSPEGGLRFRLRMSPKATADKPNRLIIWLHPSGSSMNKHVEPLAQRFLKNSFALLVFTQKDFRSWGSVDAGKLRNRTLPEVAKIAGIDAEKPILMGYSAGGQMAFHLWGADPGKFGGLILDAAYPARRTGPRNYALMKPPQRDAVKRVPIFVLVGEEDGGARFWKRAEPVWRKAGVPLTVDYVPGKGHTWLFGRRELASLDAWLSEIAAGKIPHPEPKP